MSKTELEGVSNVEASGAIVDVVRLMSFKGDEEEGVPARLVAHVQINDGGRQSTCFGQVDASSPAMRAQLSGTAWRAMERVVAALPGQPVPADGVDALLAPIVSRVGQEVRDELVQRQRTQRRQRGIAERFARRGVRLGINLVRRRPLNSHPERNPAKLGGVKALYSAFEGALKGVRSGASRGETSDATWFIRDLGNFYDENLETLSRYAVAPVPAPPSIDGQFANNFPDADAIEPLPKDGTKGHLLEREALRNGLSSVRYPSGAFVVSDESGRRMNFKWGRSPIASGVSLSICSYKEATRRLLKRVDVPVPAGRVFSVADVDKALDYADRIGYPVVVKPVAGLRGIGVVADIRSRDALVRALELYSHSELGSDDFVIEQHVPGEDYRIVVIDGEVVAAVVRAPASVTGDGLHTIADLVEYKNRARRENPHLSSRPIKFSEAMRYQLAENGLAFDSIPAAGQQVLLANSANLSQGGDSFEVAHELHPSVKEVATRAVEAVPGLGFCGLDMLIEDHRRPVDQQQATVIELNAHAAIGSAEYPMWGNPTPVAKMFFEASAQAYGITLPEVPAENLAVEIDVRGRVTGPRYLHWLQRHAERQGVAGSIQGVGRRRVTARLQGRADAVSAMVYLASRGPGNTLPTSVTTTHCPPFEATGFHIPHFRLRWSQNKQRAKQAAGRLLRR